MSQDVDTALLKLYCKEDPVKLLDFLAFPKVFCDGEDCLQLLNEFKRHHASALLLLKLNKHTEAFNIWTQLLKGSIEDIRFPGMECFIENLVK